jgi:uncharacterized protein (DUF1810 family)
MYPPDTSDPFDLQRFVAAQDLVYAEVCSELKQGYKEGHWMWFIFPQLKGLGSSPMSRRFGISGVGEAEAYLRHPILGARLRECTRLVISVAGRSIDDIFGDVDATKLRSCMTLFAHVADDSIFSRALKKFFGGKPDQLTLARL